MTKLPTINAQEGSATSDDPTARPYLGELIKKWGMARLSIITGYTPGSINEWSPARRRVPPDAALRLCAHEDAGHAVEELCPGFPWHLIYPGPDRRTSSDNLASNLEEAIKEVGVTPIARAAGRSDQDIDDAIGDALPPVWLVLALEQASAGRYLVEDWRADLPWFQLYGEQRGRGAGSLLAPASPPTPAARPTSNAGKVFVFGSNLAGRHGKGAALHAVQRHGARYGQGIGLQGQAYAIPTKDHRLRPLPLSEIKRHVEVFLAFATSRPDLTFEVTPVGCGLAGYHPQDIAPLFRLTSDNVHLPEEFMAVLGRPETT